MKTISLLFFLVLALLQPGRSSQATDGRPLVEAYVAAFNSGEEAMRSFFEAYVSHDALAQRPIDARLAIYRQMHENFLGLSIAKVEEVTRNSITALMHTKKDEWFKFTFELEPGPPLKMVAIRVEDAESPESKPEPKLTEKQAITTVEQFLAEKTKKDEFSGTVLVAKNGKPLFKRAYGTASKEFSVPNRIDTKFNLGSINKSFTQIAVGQLFEQGKLLLSDPVIKYLPDYPNKDAAEKITIRQLLDMTSGVGDFFGEKFVSTPKDKFRAIADFLPMFAGDSLEFQPGTQNRYSNGGFIVLGAIIEKVSGESYYDYVREHIFKPAGMENTESYEADVPISNLAEGYTRESLRDHWRNNIYTRPARGSSAGGGYSTVEDLLKFTSALEKNAFFTKPETWNTLRGGEPSGSGAQKKGQEGGIGIFGGAPGINSGIETHIGRGYTAIVMSNYDPPTARDAMKKIRELLKRVR